MPPHRREYIAHNHLKLYQVELHPDSKLSQTASRFVSDILTRFVIQVVEQAVRLANAAGEKTVTVTAIIHAIKSLLPGELFKLANARLLKDMKFKQQNELVRGICADVRRIARLHLGNMRYGQANKALGICVGYLAEELLELGGNVSREFKKITISDRHVAMAIEHDTELNAMYLRLTGTRAMGGYATQKLKA